jgi:hypothetical protein
MEYKDICLDIQGLHKYNTRANTTHDQVLKELDISILWDKKKKDISIPLAHQTRYKLNLNYVAIVKYDRKKLLMIWFIWHVEEATWLSPIVVVSKKNSKFKICVDFIKLNVVTKKYPYSLPIPYEVLNTIEGYDACSFLNGYFNCHPIYITPEDIYKTTLVID